MIPNGRAVVVGQRNSVMMPAGVMRPMRAALVSVNQMLPSGPAVRRPVPALGVGVVNSVTAPQGVMRPSSLVAKLANQMLPSAPKATSPASALPGSGNSRRVPCAGLAPVEVSVNVSVAPPTVAVAESIAITVVGVTGANCTWMLHVAPPSSVVVPDTQGVAVGATRLNPAAHAQAARR